MGPKTNAMFLNEQCAKNSAQLHFEYELASVVNTQNNVFKCTCTVSNWSGENHITLCLGSTKKGAMHGAAALMCRELKISQTEVDGVLLVTPQPEISVNELMEVAVDTVSGSGGNTRNVVEDLIEIQEMGLKGNPIGDLVSFSEANSTPGPDYTEEPMYGPPHSPLFVVWCSVGKVKDKGTTNKKKISKRVAAYKVLVALNELKESNHLETVETKVTTIEEGDKLHRLVEKHRERSPHPLKRNNNTFSRTVEESRKTFEGIQQCLQTIKAGKYLQELLDATLTLRSYSPNIARKFVKDWMETRNPEHGGFFAFFDRLRKELNITFNMLRKVESSTKVRHRVSRREGQSTDLIDFQSMMRNSPNGKSVHMVVLNLETKEASTSEIIPHMPSAVGFGATEDEAHENAIIEVLVSFAIMCRTVTL